MCSQASSGAGGRERAGATALRVGEGKSGPGAAEGSGCLVPAKGSTPDYLLQRNLVQGGFSGVGTGCWVGWAQSGTSGWAGSPLSPRR